MSEQEAKHTGGDVEAAPPAGGSQLAGSPIKGGKRSRKGLFHFKKGSKEAKDFMAKLRAMRGKTRKGKKKGGNPHSVGGTGSEHVQHDQAGSQMHGGATCSDGSTPDENNECQDGSTPTEPGNGGQAGGRRHRKSHSKKHKKVKGGRKSRKHCKGKKGWKMW